MSSIVEILKKIGWASIPALLLLLGNFLAETFTSNATVLNYSASKQKVGSLVSIFIVIQNYSPTAIDEFKFTAPSRDLLQYDFEPPPASSSAQKSSWVGQLPVNSKLRILLVFRNSAPPVVDLLKQSASGQYQARDESTGLLEWTKVELVEGTQPTLPRAVEYVSWYLAPTLVGAIILILAVAVSRRRSGSSIDTDNVDIE